MGQCTTAEAQIQKRPMPLKPGEADDLPTSQPVRKAVAIKRPRGMFQEKKQELVDYLEEYAPRSPKSPKSSAAGLEHQLSHSAEPQLLPVRSAELAQSSSLSHSLHLICAELVEELQNLGEGSVCPKQLQLLVKHVDARYWDTPVEAVHMSDQTIVGLTGKSNDHIADYIELAYEEDWIRVFHQFLGLGALRTGFTKLEAGVFEVVWPGGIRMRQSLNPVDVRNEVAEFGKRYVITRFDYCDDGREFGYCNGSWLPSRFGAGEPLIKRVDDLPEHMVISSPVVQLRETTNWSSELASEEAELENEREAEQMAELAAEQQKQIAELAGEECTSRRMHTAENLRVENAHQEAEEKVETEQPDTLRQSNLETHRQTESELRELLCAEEEKLNKKAEKDAALKPNVQADLKEIEKQFVLSKFNKFKFMNIKQFMRKAGVPRAEVDSCLDKFELWKLAQNHQLVLPNDSQECY